MGERWKAGDRILVDAIIESVFDGVSNWPVKIVLDNGDSNTIDFNGNVHYSAIHQGPNDALVKALTDSRAAIASLPMEALGYASAENNQAHWPIRDELLHNIDEALAKVRP